MDSFIVYSQDGKTERCILNQLEYNGEFMGACSVTFSISSPTPIEFQIGDYLIYREERFELNYIPTELKKSSKGTNGESFNYQDVQFNSLSDELVRCSFLDYVVGDNLIHYSSLPVFSFYAESINALAERIQVNLDRIYKGEKKWTVTVHPEYVNVSNKNITVDNISVWDALALANSEFKANFTIKGRTITIGTAGIAIGKLFSYGKGNGLYSIQKTTEEDQGIITRLRAYGSTRNMPNRYYNKLSGSSSSNYLPNNMAVENLMLPDFPKTTLDPYIDSPNISTLGIREGSVYFDGSGDLEEIYPSMEGITADQLRAAGISISLDEGDNGNLDEVADAEQLTDDGTMDDIEEGENIPAFTITLKDIGFDINDYLTSEAATISMKSGMCGGREFEIAQCEKVGNKYVLTCNRSYDESLKLYFPYKGYNISPGDEFVLLNIDMPDVYIQAASQRLLTAAKDYLAQNDYVRYSYEPKVDDIFMARQHEEATSRGEKSIHDTLKEGDLMLFEDTDLNINGSVIIQSLTINEGKSSIPSYEIILRNDKTVGTLEKIQNQIDSLSSGQGRGGFTTQQIESIIRAFGNKIFLSKTTNDRTPFKLEVGDKLTAEKGIQISKNFVSGIIGGSGGYIYLDENGKVVIETDKAVFREELIVPQITFNCIDVISGDKANTFAYGTIKTVDTENRIATLDLLEGQYGTLHVSDICRGIFHNIGGGNTDKDTIGANGFIEYSGFATSYFTPTNILENEAGIMKFEYELQVGTNIHPMPGMNFFAYGNFTDEDRQDITYENRYYTRRITHVNNWVIDPETNIEMQVGKLNGLSIGGMDFSGYSFYGKNVYISGTIERLKPNGTPAKDLSYEGVWESGRKYDYYDSVTHDGSTWACMNKNGSSAEPGTNNDWQKIASKGDPGESAVFADLTNEMDNVTLTNDGKVYQDTSINTVVWMSYGTKKMTLTGITCALPANVTETHDVSTGEITFSVKQGVALDGRNPIPVALTATYNGKTYTGQLTFTMAGVKGGADAVLYRLVPSVSAVIKDANGNLNVTSVSCTRLKSSVSGGTAETGTGELKYSLDGGAEVSIGNNAGVPVSSFQKSIKFVFYVDGTVVDVETIPLVVDGKDGAQGPQGVPGPAGADGKTLYTWIKYADDAQGGGISNNPTGKAYIGFAYNKETATESNDPSDYTWSDIKGEDGIPGAAGADGKTYYTWVAYSDNADGTGMYQQPKDTTKYIGIAVNKETATESNNPSDYTWSKFKGEDGQSVSSLGRWHTGLIVPKLGIVTMGGSTFCAKKETANPPLWTTTTNDGRRITQTQDGGRTYGYILSGESNTEEYDLLVQSGKDGSDGTDYERVFIHTTEENRPSTPATSQTDDYIPSGWHDDPIGVSESLPFEWISERKKRNGIWSNFSTPALWAKYGFDGIDGAEGVAGTSIVWKGDFSSAPSSPQNGWAYKNTTDKKSYVYQDGQWYQMTIDGIDGKNGKDGLSIVWKGDLQSPPSNPQINWAYRDTNNGRVYIWNGTAWSLMVVDGSDGADGAAGSNGLSVFITYNDSTSQPSVPTGNGTTGGWHTNATSGAIWMSQKVASSASDGTWGTPIKIKGDKGESITAMGRWYTGLIVPKQGVVTMGGSSYIAKKETTNPPLWTVTTSSGQRIKQTQDGGKTYGYILSGEMNSAEYDLLASKGEDGKPGVNGKPGADGKPGEKGEQGIQGCIIRHSEWAVGVTYRNDEALTSGTRYVDIAMIRNNAAIDGWDVYKCNTTHTSSESNKPGVSSSTWTKLSGVGPIYTSLVIAKNGSIDFFQGNQLLIKNSANKPVLGMTGGDHEGYITDVRLWIDEEKGMYPDRAKFRVYKSGRVVATDVDLTGTINAISGTIAGFKISGTSISSINGAYDGGSGNNSYSNSKFFLHADGSSSAFMGFSATNKWVGIGLNCMPATSNMQVLGRFEDTGTSSYTYNKAGLYISIAGATTYDDSSIHGNSALYIPKGHITGFRRRFRRVSTSTTLTNMDSIVRLVNTAEITVTLPAGCEDGQEIWLCSGNEKKVNVTAASGDTITGSGGSFASNRWHIYIYDAHNRDWVYGYTNY